MTWTASLRHLLAPRRTRVVVPVMAAALALVGVTGQAIRPGPTASAEADSVPATVTISSDGVELRLDGDFTEGTARRIRRALRANAGVRVLSLRSEGGLVDEAEQVGDIVSAYRLATFAPDICISACTLAFVRGRERFAAPDAQLGFHAPWEAGSRGEEVQVSSDEERQAYVSAGIAPDFVDRALSTPSSEVWFPDRDRLLRSRVVGAFVPPSDIATRVGDSRNDYASVVTPNE